MLVFVLPIVSWVLHSSLRLSFLYCDPPGRPTVVNFLGMEFDATVKRAQFIQQSVEICILFHWAPPLDILKL